MAKDSGLPRGIYEKVSGSKIYWIRYTDSGGNERREKCGNITAAKAKLAIRHAEKAQGHTTYTHTHTVFGTLLDDAIAHAKSENDSYSVKDLKYKLDIIRGDFAGVSVAKITKASIVAWLEEQGENRAWSNATRNRYQAAWSLVFRVAIENKKVRENPAAGIKRRREDNARTRWLTPEEEQALTRAIEERFPSYVHVYLLALHTGMRASELLRSRVGDYDATTGMFRVRQKKVRTAPFFRYVPATPIAILAYKRLAEGRPNNSVLCCKQERGGDPDLTETRYWFEPCVEAAGLVDFLWHDLRHTYASRLVMGGEPLAAVSRYMGHQSITMTMRYSHLMQENHSKTIATMMSYYPQIATGTDSGTGTLQLVSKGRN